MAKRQPLKAPDLTLADALEASEEFLKLGSSAQAKAAQRDPFLLTEMVEEVLEKFRAEGAERLFEDDRELAVYYRATMERFLVRGGVVLDLLLDELTGRLQNHEGSVRELSAAINVISGHLESIQQRTRVPGQGPMTLEELDQRLEERRRQMTARGLLPAPTPPAPSE